MSDNFTFGDLIQKGAIIDNRRIFLNTRITLKDVLKKLAEGSQGFKSAVGYFYIEGLSEIVYSLQQLKDIKILMGGETTPKTKKELIKAFREKFNQIEENEITIPAIALFHRLVKEAKILKVRVFFGEKGKFQRLHSKAYLFIRDAESNDILERYRAGVIGSSNLTPSGLIGNTELNVIIDRNIDLAYLEKWFDELWQEGTEEFEKLRVADALTRAIERSKFGKHLEEAYKYLEPEMFFKALIKFLRADYLFEDWKKSGLFKFQVVDTIRCLRLFKESNYRGVFLTSSVGLGKSYVACEIGEIFLRDGAKILIIAPANLVKSEDQWPRYLKEFKLWGKVELVSMGELQKNPDRVFDKRFRNYATRGRIKLDTPNKYGLIIVDEAHNYRNEDAYRTRNLKKIIDFNGNAKLMFLTATPINTSLDDLLNLIKLFHRPGQNLHFDKMVRDVTHVINLITDKEFEELTENEKRQLSERQEEIEKELFIKSTRETIKTSKEYVRELKEFSGVDIRHIPDPDVNEAEYTLHQNYKPIVNGIVDFISNLTAAHLRIVDPERGIRLSGFFKWLLYKRFESSITAYYLTLKRLARKNERIVLAVENQDSSYLEPDYEDDININFNIDFRENIEKVISKIKRGEGQEHLAILDDLKRDTELVKQELQKLDPYAITTLRFENDYKLEELYKLLEGYKGRKILLFTQYRDTLKAIRDFLKDRTGKNTVRYVSSEVKNKNRIIETFNDGRTRLRLLFSTDTLSEGFNIGGADVVVNFDIPYNPVRIIQRIGRATRLDNPKKIDVVNFKPDEDIDKELDLVERMDLRIKDIIKFVGVEYRVWIDRENEIRELLKERRLRDVEIYLEVLKSIRSDLTSGRFENLEVEIKYTKPTLILLQKAIKEFGLTRKDVEEASLPLGNNYTALKGNKDIVVYCNRGDIYNEEKLTDASLDEISRTINFERQFSRELDQFDAFLRKQRKRGIVLRFYTDRLDRTINNVLDLIQRRNLAQLYPAMDELEDTLYSVKENCGSTTERVAKEIYRGIRNEKISNEKVRTWIKELGNSFTRREVQEKLVKEPSRMFAIAMMEE